MPTSSLVRRRTHTPHLCSLSLSPPLALPTSDPTSGSALSLDPQFCLSSLSVGSAPVSYTHLRAHETEADL
eukprot:2757270-Rhodomonas_salina.1